MNKKLSRIAAIALSAAMVTSAFAMSTSSAFAATAVTITPATNTYAAVYNDTTKTNNKLTAASVFTDKTATVAADKDSATQNLDFGSAEYSVSSGTDVATITAGVLTINKTGSFTVKATKVKLPETTLETVKHGNTEKYASTEVTTTATVNVYTSGAVLVLPTIATPASATGTVVSNAETVGINETPSFTAYQLGQSAAVGTEAAATYAPETDYTLASSNSNISLSSASGVATVAKQKGADVHTGYAFISATSSKSTDPKAVSASLTVGDYYTVNGAETPAVDTTYGYDTATTLGTGSDNKVYNVTGKDIHVPATATLNLTDGNANVGTVSGAGTVNVNAGTVKAITATGAVTVNSNAIDKGNAIVGDISGAASVTVTGATAANTDKTYSSVKVGNITTDGAVTIKSTQNTDKSAQGLVTVGNVTSKAAVSVDTSVDASTLTAGTFSGVAGKYADCPFAATFTLVNGKLKTGDLQNFGKVSVAGATSGAETVLTAGAINTGSYADTAVAAYDATANTGVGKGDAKSDSTISVTDGAKLNASSIYVLKAPSANKGSVTVPADALTIADSSVTATQSTGLTLYVTGTKKGTVVYKANSTASGLFNIPGVTTVLGTNTGKNIYNYTADKVDFLGFQLNTNQIDLGKGASTTLTTTLLPDMDLPTGVTIAWTADKDTVKLTPSADGRTCTVAENGYTAENVNGGNNIKVTANLVKDGAAYAPFNSDKATDACVVTLTAAQAPVLTTTVTDLDGKTQTVTGDSVIKMTQSTYNTVKFSADKAGIASIAYITGNDKVAQTGTASAWNGTAGTYNIYANGAVGSKVGVFANGVKVFQVEIVDRPFKCDTTLDLDGVKGKALTVGQKYSFKITPADGTKIDTFTFLTANDAAVASWGYTKNADGTVTATIKALKSTSKVGVYAKINGVTYKVFAAAVK